MRVLLDQGVPAPLRRALDDHSVATAHEQGWASLTNGELLTAAETTFDVFITTDQNLRYQQNLAGRRLAILVLPTTSWPRLRVHAPAVAAAVAALRPGELVVLPRRVTGVPRCPARAEPPPIEELQAEGIL